MQQKKSPLKVLITGSNGLLGQKLIELLATEEHAQIVATSRGKDRYPEPGGYTYTALDITDHTAVARLLDLERPDVVFHTAAMTSVDICEADPQGCEELNVDASANLALVCAQIGAHLIHISTDFVFDGRGGPYVEADDMEPLSVYGNSKMRSEFAVAAAGGAWSIVRTILVYGVLKDKSRGTIVSWVKESLESGNTVRVVNDQYRMPTLVEDLAAACWDIALGGHMGIYHISGKDCMSIAELAASVARCFSLDRTLISEISSTMLENAELRPKTTGFKLDKAHATFNYNPRSFEEGLKLVAKQLKI